MYVLRIDSPVAFCPKLKMKIFSFQSMMITSKPDIILLMDYYCCYYCYQQHILKNKCNLNDELDLVSVITVFQYKDKP